MGHGKGRTEGGDGFLVQGAPPRCAAPVGPLPSNAERFTHSIVRNRRVASFAELCGVQLSCRPSPSIWLRLPFSGCRDQQTARPCYSLNKNKKPPASKRRHGTKRAAPPPPHPNTRRRKET